MPLHVFFRLSASADAVLLTIVVISNSGLYILMLLLGYGLISFPQMLWGRGDIKRQQRGGREARSGLLRDIQLVLDVPLSQSI
jgi:hypothetical protein